MGVRGEACGGGEGEGATRRIERKSREAVVKYLPSLLHAHG